MFNGKPFPIPCPACRHLSGWPARAQSVDGGIVVDFRCEECGSEWPEPLPTVATRSVNRSGAGWPLVERRKTTRHANARSAP